MTNKSLLGMRLAIQVAPKMQAPELRRLAWMSVQLESQALERGWGPVSPRISSLDQVSILVCPRGHRLCRRYTDSLRD
jgi:hypothetical protein